MLTPDSGINMWREAQPHTQVNILFFIIFSVYYFLWDLPHVYLLPWVQTAVSPVDTYVLSCKNSISSDLKNQHM